MKQLLFLYIILSISACTQTTLSSDLLILDNIAYIKNHNTPFSGIVKSYHGNGHKKLMGTYIKGKRHGIWQGWYAHGQKKFIHHYKEGKRFGEQLEYDENGKLIEGSNTTYYQL